MQRIKKDISDGVFHDAFLPTVINDGKLLGFPSEGEAAYLSLQLVIRAADTSRMSTWSFLEAMMMYPEVQVKARREIEAYMGDRSPVFADLEQVPCVRCLMKEVWRWRPPVALDHPHTTTRELVYDGYRIPKGSRLHINAWAIGHDPQRHQDPDRFWPERYADDHTTTMQSINSSGSRQHDHFAFGSGRRICPCYHVAERSLAVAIMRILWAFDIAPAPGTKLPLDPRDYPPDMPGNPGTNLPVTLKVRSEEKKRIINAAYEAEQKTHIPMPRISGFALGSTTLLLFQLGLTAEDVTLPSGRIPGHGPSQSIIDVLGTESEPKQHLKQHFCLAVKDREDVAKWEEALKERGVQIMGTMDWEKGGRSVYFADPDGHVGEIGSRGIWSHY
ncbi:hypothetical protein H2201_007121 [Coniosporium apollinis]|uniref:VOC domain-containing protein n=1 Tax=Coniosporium apollinis TaxID=61459 RepID=A0ABQ9NJY5_9PEZI|nr:hypothetical protein H2201_007121 [Coniosporium apollinis]